MERRSVEENPFEDEKVAAEWMMSVEGEQGLTRDNFIYPFLATWSANIHGVIVDIGSGQGICSEKLRLADDARYIGVEPSVPLLKRAQEKHAASNREFLKGDAFALPLENDSADACFSINVWFHIEDLEGAAQEMARVLKPSGQFVIITANPAAEKKWESFYQEGTDDGKRIVGKIDLAVSPLSRSTFYRHSREEIIGALTAAGLKVEEETTFRKSDDGDLFVRVMGMKE
jgi:ubiquinone/menaquinone biosynthesis C-methylase UbiE